MLGAWLRAIHRWTPILMFHEIVPDNQALVPPYAIRQSRLRVILADFARRGYHAGTLDDVLVPRRGKRLVLTFDDGTADFVEHALPVLEEFRARATLFIVTGCIGGRRSWPTRAGAPLPAVPLLAAADLRALAGRGFTIGSHSITHRPLPGLPAGEVEEEIRGSRDQLAHLLGQPVHWFAYPYTALDPRTQAWVCEAGYAGACGGYHHPASRYGLIRLDASVFSLEQLRMRSSGLFQTARQLARRARAGGRAVRPRSHDAGPSVSAARRGSGKREYRI